MSHLQLGEAMLPLLWGRVDLFRCQKQVLLKVKPHHLIHLTPIAKTAHYMPKHLAIMQVVTIQQDHTICNDTP